MSMQPMETYVGDALTQAAGDPFFLGIMLLGFFFGFVMLQGVRLDSKLLVLVPIAILAIPFIPWLPVVIGLVCAVIAYFAFTKFDNK